MAKREKEGVKMLEINNIFVNYGSVEALQDVSLSVGKHEIVALIGNNGAGKSTTLRAISGQVEVSKGSIVFDGVNITKKPVHKITEMGIIHVPEGRKIFYKLNVKENLMMGAFTQKDKTTIADSLDYVLDTFPILKDRIRQQGGTLSGGEQQMLAVGRALMAKPRILLFDEPSLGLAPLIVETVIGNIIKISETGTPILLVEQNASLALDVSDRAYVLDTGEIQMSGKSSELASDDAIQKAYLGIA